MRRSAGLDPDQARRQLLKERQNVAPPQLTTDNHLAFRINAMDLKHRLGDVETDSRNRLHVGSSETWALNNTHFHDTRVPVEEPSTASDAAGRSTGGADYTGCVGSRAEPRRPIVRTTPYRLASGFREALPQRYCKAALSSREERGHPLHSQGQWSREAAPAAWIGGRSRQGRMNIRWPHYK